MTENAWGRITLFPEAIAKYARAKGLDPVGEAWATLRHEMTHTARVFAFRATGQVQTMNAYLNARGRGFFYDEFVAETIGRGTTEGVAPFVFRGYHRPKLGQPLNFTTAQFRADLQWATTLYNSAVNGASFGAGALAGAGAALGTGVTAAIGADQAYDYFFPPPPPITVLPPITLP